MIALFRRWVVVGLCLSLLVGVLAVDGRRDVVRAAGLEEAAAPGPLEPLGVSGTPDGEQVLSTPVDDRVLLEAPTDAQLVDESLTERMARERAAAPKPEVVGFDPQLSVEDVSRRSEFGTVFDNQDGTSTAQFDDEAVNYRLPDGSWEKIDPRLVPVRGQDGTYKSAASDVIVTASKTGVEIRGVAGETVVFRPGGPSARLSTPEISGDGLTATYLEVWPGVDVRFRMSNTRVSKEIVLKRPGTESSFEMTVGGIQLAQGADEMVKVVGKSEFSIGQMEVLDKTGTPVADADSKLELVPGGESSTLLMSVSDAWLAERKPSEFPIVIDPSFTWTTPLSPYASAWASNGFFCPTNPGCPRPRVGNSLASGDTIWRSVFTWDYSSVQPTATVASQLISATVNVSYYGGQTSSQPIALRRATAHNWCGFNENGDCGQPLTSPTVQNLGLGSLSFDVTSIINGGYWGAGQPNVGWAFSSDESSGVYTFKELQASITLTYDRLPVIPSTGMSPTDPYVTNDKYAGVHLSIPQLTDPDGEPLYYRFVLCTTGCGIVKDDSGWVTLGSLDPWGSPDYSPWDYMSGWFPTTLQFPAGMHNQQYYWTAMVSNSPIGSGFVSTAPWWNQWKVQNTCPATPQMAPSTDFEWAPNSPPTFTVTPYADADGDTARYRVVIREKNATGVLWTSEWTAFTTSTAPLTFQPPASVPLQAGVMYEWSAEAQDSTTQTHWYHYHGAPCSAASSFRSASFDDRLGAGGPSPMQASGPVTVNLATGNVTTAVSTPQVSTLGGAMGVSMAYNSRANDIGLRGRYFNDANTNGLADSGELVSSRLDRSMVMKWTSPGAVPGVSHLVGTWTGFLTVPASGTYHIAAAVGSDERVEVKVGTYTVKANHVNPAAIPINDPTGTNSSGYLTLANVSAVPSTGFTTYTPNTVLPITITYSNPTADGYLALYLANGSGTLGTFPITWLSPEARVLPRGWTFNNLDSLGAEYSSARVEATQIVLTRPDGSTVAYTQNGTGYTPPIDEDDIVALTNGKVTVTTASGTVHSFSADGQLEQIKAPVDAKAPAAPYPTWTTTTLAGWTQPISRMTSLTDPLSTSPPVTLKYEGVGSGTCPTDTGLGFIAPSPGMLCQITYPDATTTKLWYQSDQQGGVILTRVTNPGNSTIGYPTVDFGYQLVALPTPKSTPTAPDTYTVPMLASVRDPLVADAITSGTISDLPAYRTQIAYDSEGRVSSVTAPKAAAAAGDRQQIWVDYQIISGITYNETRTRIKGLDNTGSSTDWDRKAQFDDLARSTYDYQATNSTSSTTMLTQTGWDGLSDRPLWQQVNNQITRYVYSTEGWVTDVYGPANASCFATVTFMPDGDCTSPPVPHTSNVYDSGLNGLSGSYWPNATFTGQPTNLATGIGPNYTTLSNDWTTTGPPEAVNSAGAQLSNDYSIRLTGSIVFPATGVYTITTTSDDSAQVYIDDQLVTSSTCCSPVAGTVSISGSPTKRIRIDYVETTLNSKLVVQWAGPGVTGTVAIPTTVLKPRYGLLTSTTTDDSGGAPSSTTTTTYTATGIDAIYGLPVTATTAGLTTTTGYETSSGYRRRTSRTLPGGNTYTYTYYTDTGTNSTGPVDVPCTTQNDTTVHQGGRQSTTTAPTAADGKALLSQAVYDVWGRTVATRRGYRVSGTDTWDSTWSCTTFDARNRPTTTTIPARGSYPARTITTTYSTTNPLTITVGDASGTITTVSDLVGRTTSYTDVSGQVNTSTYDPTTGRLTTNSGPTGSTGYTYDRAGRVTQQTLDGNVIAIPTYNTPGTANEHTLASINYPSGAGNGGNGTTGTFTRNTNGAVTAITWTGPGGTITSDTVTRSQTGRVIDQSIDGTDPYPAGNNFTYDTAGRLTAARGADTNLYEYDYNATGGCGANTTAGKNANRTAARVNGISQATFCYDNADRLTTVTGTLNQYAPYAGTITYDNWGNTTTIGGEELAYDGADRHMATYAPNATSPTASVVYQRDVTDRIISRTATGNNIAHRSSTTASSGSSTVTSLAVNKPAGTVAGDVLLAAISTRKSSGTAASITPPSGWTLADQSLGSGGHGTHVYYKVAGGSEPASYTFTLSVAAKAVIAVSAYTGVNTTTPIDATGTATNATLTAQTAPAAAASGTNRVVYNAWAVSGLVTYTPVSDTERTDVATASGTAVSLTTGDRQLTASGTSGTSIATSSVAEAGRHITVLLRPATTTEQHKYIYSATGDTGDATTDWAGTIIERTIPLPGGVILIKRGSGDVWSYPNIHGDIQATAGAAGLKTGPTHTYDPYGTPLTTTIDNTAGNIDNAWLGQHQRPYEHTPGLNPTIQMGARPYNPTLGRFLEVDPVEGGTANDYTYPNDPMNQLDINGHACIYASGLQGGQILGRGVVQGICPSNDKYAKLADDTARARGRWYSRPGKPWFQGQGASKKGWLARGTAYVVAGGVTGAACVATAALGCGVAAAVTGALTQIVWDQTSNNPINDPGCSAVNGAAGGVTYQFGGVLGKVLGSPVVSLVRRC